MALGRQEIIDYDDRPVEELDVPEWGGTVLVRALNGKQREEIEVRTHQAQTSGNALGWKGLKALTATYVLVDEDHKPLFMPKDAALLENKGSGALNRIFDFVLRTNGMTKEDAEALAGN